MSSTNNTTGNSNSTIASCSNLTDSCNANLTVQNPPSGVAPYVYYIVFGGIGAIVLVFILNLIKRKHRRMNRAYVSQSSTIRPVTVRSPPLSPADARSVVVHSPPFSSGDAQSATGRPMTARLGGIQFGTGRPMTARPGGARPVGLQLQPSAVHAVPPTPRHRPLVEHQRYGSESMGVTGVDVVSLREMLRRRQESVASIPLSTLEADEPTPFSPPIALARPEVKVAQWRDGDAAPTPLIECFRNIASQAAYTLMSLIGGRDAGLVKYLQQYFIASSGAVVSSALAVTVTPTADSTMFRAFIDLYETEAHASFPMLAHMGHDQKQQVIQAWKSISDMMADIMRSYDDRSGASTNRAPVVPFSGFSRHTLAVGPWSATSATGLSTDDPYSN